MDKTLLNSGLLSFLQSSPTPFHAVAEMVSVLDEAGFQALSERQQWQIKAAGKYYVTRNDSSIVAFCLTGDDLCETGLRMVGAHTDSPCLKIKPSPEIVKKNYLQLGVEVYGGALLNPWFDRDLSLAGRVTYVDQNGAVGNALVDFEQAIASVPSLAIHLDKEANRKRSINAQTDIPIVLGLSEQDQDWDFRTLLKSQLTQAGQLVEKVLDFDIYCYDTQPPAVTGLRQEFIASARLDNLLSCYVGLQALLSAAGKSTTGPSYLLVCNDHEEVGSASAAGAKGTLLQSVLERLLPKPSQLNQTVANSMMVSVDNAHGVHPNYAQKHDDNHGPLFNKGPAIKINASQRYASNSETSAIFRHLCDTHNIPVQSFVTRSDMGCGSTIGPITATEIGVRTLDIGVPTFAMHSIRELAGSDDPYYLLQALAAFYHLEALPGSTCAGKG